MEYAQEHHHNENIHPSFPSQSILQLKPLKKTKFSLTHKILSSIEEVRPPLQFTPYISILPQKNNFPKNYDNLTDSELSIPFKKDTIIYLDHKVTNGDKEIISGDRKIIVNEEEKKSGMFAIIIETRCDDDINKFKKEILCNCGDDCFINEGSIIYERGTDCILGCEGDKERENEDELVKLDHNVDKRYVNTFFLKKKKAEKKNLINKL